MEEKHSRSNFHVSRKVSISTTDAIMLDVKKIVGEIFGMKKEAMKLRPRSWKEPHLLLYQVSGVIQLLLRSKDVVDSHCLCHVESQALDGREPHTGIEMRYDGCAITWQAMLTRLDEYEGGGTYFRCLRKTVKMQQGQVLVHPGELYHKGIDITYGVRCLLVCFTGKFWTKKKYPAPSKLKYSCSSMLLLSNRWDGPKDLG